MGTLLRGGVCSDGLQRSAQGCCRLSACAHSQTGQLLHLLPWQLQTFCPCHAPCSCTSTGSILTRILLLQQGLSRPQVLWWHTEHLPQVGEVLSLRLDETVKVVEPVLLRLDVAGDVLIPLVAGNSPRVLLKVCGPSTGKGCCRHYRYPRTAGLVWKTSPSSGLGTRPPNDRPVGCG